MRNNDVTAEIRMAMQRALAENNTEAFAEAFEQMMQALGDDIRRDYQEMLAENDTNVLASRGIRQLTKEEKDFYQKFVDCLRSGNPKQALTDAGLTLPETVINDVFADLETTHPLLSKINFFPSSGSVKLLLNVDGNEEATWGELCDEIIKEITSGFEEKETGLYKLSAFIPICKAMLDLGSAWLDSYVRRVLYERIANGLEAGIVSGDGNKKPIGMIRQVGSGVTVTDGAYPAKDTIAVTDLEAETIGNLLAQVTVTPSGKTRKLQDVIMIVNPIDYLQKVMPATTVMAPDGTYRNNVVPYPMTIIESAAVEQGKAVLGMAGRYFASAGVPTGKDGNVDFSDHYSFLEDKRVYLIKLYANGFPMDNNAFLYLDISGLKPKTYKVQLKEAAVAEG